MLIYSHTSILHIIVSVASITAIIIRGCLRQYKYYLKIPGTYLIPADVCVPKLRSNSAQPLSSIKFCHYKTQLIEECTVHLNFPSIFNLLITDRFVQSWIHDFVLIRKQTYNKTFFTTLKGRTRTFFAFGSFLVRLRAQICHSALTFADLPSAYTKLSCGRRDEWTRCKPFTLSMRLLLPRLWNPIGRMKPT